MLKRWLRRGVSALAGLGLLCTVLVASESPASAALFNLSCYNNGAWNHYFLSVCSGGNLLPI
jgi:hypothetical protein